MPDKHTRSLNADLIGLPIGLVSSPLLANWYLKEFDAKVFENIHPAYYGRYVDDIIMVIASNAEPHEFAVRDFLTRTLVAREIIEETESKVYELVRPRGLILQEEKCILQYFNADYSIAGLEKFKKKLEENASAFMLLPVDDTDTSLADVAYDLLYDGSVNKFRSVKGLAENRYELAKHVARQTVVHLLTSDPFDTKIINDVLHFFKGKNAIEFHDIWERVLTLFVAADVSRREIERFVEQMLSEIKKVRFGFNEAVTSRLQDNLRNCLDLALGLSESLRKKGLLSIKGFKFGYPADTSWRRANLIRHHLVPTPLLNYTTYQNTLVKFKVRGHLELDDFKIKWSPRYVHFDECMMLADSGLLSLEGRMPFEVARDLFRKFNGHDVDLDISVDIPAIGKQ